MNIMQEMVEEFHRAFDLGHPDKPTLREGLSLERVILIAEELSEYASANEAGDLVEVADAIGDMLYVVLGTAVAHGIDIEPIFREIHRSNMSKVDGHRDPVTRKWIKPDNYSPANLEPLIEKQLANGIRHVVG